jgi:hypothetical protein
MTTFTSTTFNDTPIIAAASAAKMASEVPVNSVRDDEARADAARVGGWHEEFVVGGYAADAGDAGHGGDKIRPVQDTFAIDIGTSENLTLTGSAEDSSAGGAIATDNKHPELPAADAVAGAARLAADRHDDINGSTSNALVTKSGGEVIGDFSSDATNGAPGAVSDSGKDAKVVGFTDGTSNTIIFAERHALSGTEGDDLLPVGGNGNEIKVVGFVDGTSNTIAFATTNVMESVNVKYTLFSNGEDDPVVTVSDGVGDASLTDITDGTSNTLAVGRIDGSAASSVIESMAVKYTMFDGGADGLLLDADRLARQADLGMHSALRGGDVLDVSNLSVVLSNTGDSVANGPAGEENLYGNVNNIDAWVGGVVLDVGDVLVGFDDGVDNSNDSSRTRTAGGSTTLQADPDGQANGIIAVLIGLYTDNQGPLDNASPALD